MTDRQKELFFDMTFARFSEVRGFVVTESINEGLKVRVWHRKSMKSISIAESYIRTIHVLEQTPDSDDELKCLIESNGTR